VAPHHSGTTAAAGPVAFAVCKSRAILRLTTLRLNAVTPPTPARARIPATLQRVSQFLPLLPRLLPDYNAGWEAGKCIDTLPLPAYGSRPLYATQLECCKLAYAGQMNNFCIANMVNPPTASPWYHPHLSQPHLLRQAVLPRLLPKRPRVVHQKLRPRRLLRPLVLQRLIQKRLPVVPQRRLQPSRPVVPQRRSLKGSNFCSHRKSIQCSHHQEPHCHAHDGIAHCYSVRQSSVSQV
jgi:hypothetical protein